MTKYKIVVVVICMICIGIITATFEKKYEMDLHSGKTRISISILNFSIISTTKDTQLSLLMKDYFVKCNPSHYWVLDSTYTIMMPRHSPHWRYHGIISSYENLISYIKFYSAYHKWENNTVRILLSTALEKDRNCGRPISFDLLLQYVTSEKSNPMDNKDVLKLQEFINNSYRAINNAMELEIFLKQKSNDDNSPILKVSNGFQGIDQPSETEESETETIQNTDNRSRLQD